MNLDIAAAVGSTAIAGARKCGTTFKDALQTRRCAWVGAAFINIAWSETIAFHFSGIGTGIDAA